MTVLQAYEWLQEQERDVAWIANVFYTNERYRSSRAKNLHAMVTLLRTGHEISSISFTMPYDRLCVDGKDVTPEEMRQIAKSA